MKDVFTFLEFQNLFLAMFNKFEQCPCRPGNEFTYHLRCGSDHIHHWQVVD
ncbi:MAG: hypothetical protein GY874_06725 [Desulfobacteraceae bacterium]|nr:hypothetical protein [Desulfobacteraceae bacterium]